METITAFKAMTMFVGAAFLFYGMDVRRKAGSQSFIGPIWRALMMVLSLALVTSVAWLVLQAPEAGTSDWCALALLVVGTSCVVVAKRTLGSAHTFTGQYLVQPRLVTSGIYAYTRNPLYLGVFFCEAAALVLVLRIAPEVYPAEYPAVYGALAFALSYVIGFNLVMAVREARMLEEYFGERYRTYRTKVPFSCRIFSRHGRQADADASFNPTSSA